eukprot:1629562-Pyramimonas_sp.AAC.1
MEGRSLSSFAEDHHSRPQCLCQLPLYYGALAAWKGIAGVLADSVDASTARNSRGCSVWGDTRSSCCGCPCPAFWRVIPGCGAGFFLYRTLRELLLRSPLDDGADAAGPPASAVHELAR